MPWFMVDDKLHGHRKTGRASVEAMGLWVLAGSWCADHLSDGFIPDYMAKRLDPKVERHAADLVAAGFWVEAVHDGEKGWQFHDWTDLQPTRAEVEGKRAKARERMRKARDRSQEVRANSEGTSHAVTPTPSHPSPTQPNPTYGLVPEGGLTSVGDETRPPRNCKKHPKGTDEPCRACGDARKAHDAWQPPTLSAKTTKCGEHPEHPARTCPKCAEVVGPPPKGWRAS